jgi:hypothetical protein
MNQVLDEVLRTTLVEFGTRLQAILPNLLAMLVLLGAGLVAGATVRYAVGFVLRHVRFDAFARRTGIGAVLEKGGFRVTPSTVFALALGWLTLAVFVLLAVAALDVKAAVDLVNRAFAYMPNVLAALLLLIFGSLVAGFVRRSVLIGAVNAGLPSARLLAGGAQAGVLVLFGAMAMEHLALGRQVVLVSFTILFGGVVFAIALAFGLAGRDLARESLERLRTRKEPPDDLHHL